MTRHAMTSAADYIAGGPASVDRMMRITGLSEAEARAAIQAADDRRDALWDSEPDPYSRGYSCKF